MLSRQKRKELASKLRFTHFNLGEGNVTVAGALDEDTYHYGISFCAPEDNFNRQEGRHRAIRKLFSKNENAFYRGTIDFDGKDRTCDLAEKAIAECITRGIYRPKPLRWFEKETPSSLMVRVRNSKRKKVDHAL